MKTFVVLAVSIVLVSILFCPTVMVAFTMPDDAQIVQPDPSLPKELLAFFGKWENREGPRQTFVIIEKIDEQKAGVYVGRFGYREQANTWTRYEATVAKERGKYIIWYTGPLGNTELSLKGEYLNAVTRNTGSLRYSRVQ